MWRLYFFVAMASYDALSNSVSKNVHDKYSKIDEVLTKIMKSLVIKSQFVLKHLRKKLQYPFRFLYFTCLRHVEITNHWKFLLLQLARHTLYCYSISKNKIESVFIIAPQFVENTENFNWNLSQLNRREPKWLEMAYWKGKIKTKNITLIETWL